VLLAILLLIVLTISPSFSSFLLANPLFNKAQLKPTKPKAFKLRKKYSIIKK